MYIPLHWLARAPCFIDILLCKLMFQETTSLASCQLCPLFVCLFMHMEPLQPRWLQRRHRYCCLCVGARCVLLLLSLVYFIIMILATVYWFFMPATHFQYARAKWKTKVKWKTSDIYQIRTNRCGCDGADSTNDKKRSIRALVSAMSFNGFLNIFTPSNLTKLARLHFF